MSIISDLSNHVDVIREGLTTLSLDVPDRLLQILDTRARYKTGVAGAGFSFTHLRNSPDVTYYTGADRDESSENDPTTTQIIATWCDAMVPMQFVGTDLQQTLGMTTAEMTRDGYGLGDMSSNDRLMFMNFVESQAEVTAYSIQAARVNSLWGKSAGIAMTDENRLPVSLPDIFDQDTGLYGEDRNVLGGFERQHPWHGDGAFGSSRDALMVPRLWDFAYENGYNGENVTVAGRTATRVRQLPADGSSTPRGVLSADEARGILNPDGTLDENAFHDLQRLITEFSQIVPGTKVAICNNETFSALAIGFRGDNQPMINLDKWEYTIKCVQIDSCYFISDPQKSVDSTTIEIYHIGSNGGNQGSIFPFYWDPGANVRETMMSKVDAKLRDVPDGLTFGPRRRIPLRMDPFTRFEGMADAVGARMRLSYMIIVMQPWMQCQLTGIAARRRPRNDVVTT